MSEALGRFVALERVDRMQEGYRRVFVMDGQDLLLLRHKGEDYLLDNICPHAGYPLHEGQILGRALRCPMHGYLFDLQSGVCTHHPEGPCRALKVFPLELHAGWLGTRL